MQTAVAARPDAGASAEGPVQDLERSLLYAKKHLHAVQAETHILKVKELKLLDIHKSLERQVAVLSTELCPAQVELVQLALQCNGGCGRVNKLTVEGKGTVALQVKAIENL